jgi:threonine dehydrogenase-like Zn-dependent dehydrogenase
MKVKALECTGINILRLADFKKPEPEFDSLLMKIKTCGICGTDIHGIEGKRSINYPFIPGHEIVGVVESFGKDACKFIKIINADSIKIGDRVTINPRIVCGRCYYCQNFPLNQEMCINSITATSIGSKGYPHLFGGWSEYLYVLPGSEIIKLPDNLSDGLATLIEPYTCAVGCVDNYERIHDWKAGDSFKINDTVVVYGVGAIGILIIAGFSLAGADEIIAVDARDDRLKLATEFGAKYTINVSSTTQEERVKSIKSLTENLGAGVVVEACGVPEVIGEGIGALKRGGILFEIGHLLNAGDAKIDPYSVCRNEIKIIGRYAYPTSQSMLYSAKILEQEDFPYDKLLRFYRLDQYQEAIFDKKVQDVIKLAFKMYD